MAMIKGVTRLISLLILVAVLLSPTPVLAGPPNSQCPGGPTDSKGNCLDNCNESGYCAGNTWMEKKCKISPDLSPSVLDELNNAGKPTCICTYTPTKDSCGTPGGISRNQGSAEKVIGSITPPKEISALGIGARGINNLLQLIIQLIYIAAGVAFVVLFLWSAFQLIISGGSKEGIASARQHITWSIIGLAMLALAFPFFRLLEGILGFKFFG